MIRKNPKKPLVSIILPVYKSEQYLESCLKSLSYQTYKNIEIVAVVDYLGDNSLKILRRHKKIDKRLKIYNNKQRYGLASTLNRAVKHSKADYLAFMESTAIADKSRISKQLKFLQNNEKVGAVGTQISYINDKNSVISNIDFPLTNDDIHRHLISGETFKFESSMVAKTRLPRDIIKFNKDTAYPFVYSQVFAKINMYSELANLPDVLLKTRDISNPNKKLIRMDRRVSFIKVLFESTTQHDYKPSIKSIFSPIIRQV